MSVSTASLSNSPNVKRYLSFAKPTDRLEITSRGKLDIFIWMYSSTGSIWGLKSTFKKEWFDTLFEEQQVKYAKWM